MSDNEKGKQSALAKLSALTGAKGVDEIDDEEEADQQRIADMERVLNVAQEITDNDIWEMQALIEDCAAELRVQIREEHADEEEV